MNNKMAFKESEKIEFKETYTPDIKKEVIAFANTHGGTIYVGIDDSGKIVGVSDADYVAQKLSNSIMDSIRPDVSMFVHVELLQQDNRPLIKITVEQGTKKPYYLYEKVLKPTGVYVRSGTTTCPASEDAIRTMIKVSDGDSFEANRSLVQDLTFNSLSEEMAKRNLEFTKIQMKNIGILSADNLYTKLGLLVSDQCKHSIKFAFFQGTDKLVFRDRKEFTGSIFKQLNDAYQVIDFYNATRASFKDLMRIDERDFPEDAIREALLNAIVHRDYSFSGNTFINLYTDRLEFISLGGLVPGLSLEAAKLGASQPRNEKLAALFYRMKLIEAYGTGFNKIISSYKGFPMQPVFENVEGAFRVTLPNRHSNLLTENEHFNTILSLFQNQPEITRADVESVLGVGSTQALNTLNKMLFSDLIIKQGSGRNTRYLLRTP